MLARIATVVAIIAAGALTLALLSLDLSEKLVVSGGGVRRGR
jgi:hypothetical protein